MASKSFLGRLAYRITDTFARAKESIRLTIRNIQMQTMGTGKIPTGPSIRDLNIRASQAQREAAKADLQRKIGNTFTTDSISFGDTSFVVPGGMSADEIMEHLINDIIPTAEGSEKYLIMTIMNSSDGFPSEVIVYRDAGGVETINTAPYKAALMDSVDALSW